MVIPQYLKKDSKIAIVSPAGKIRKDFVIGAVELIKFRFIPIVFPGCFNEHFQAAEQMMNLPIFKYLGFMK